VTDAFDRKPWRPVTPRARRHQGVGCRSGQLRFEGSSEAVQCVSKCQNAFTTMDTIVSCVSFGVNAFRTEPSARSLILALDTWRTSPP
jgi:hypothetical protein